MSHRSAGSENEGWRGDTKKGALPRTLSKVSILQLLDIVFLLELLHATRCINYTLFIGVKRMTAGTYFHVKVLYSRPCFYLVATGTLDNSLFIFWMDSLFHQPDSPLRIHCFEKGFIVSGGLHLLNKQFHGLCGTHGRKRLPENP